MSSAPIAIVPRPSLVAYASRVRVIENPIAPAASRQIASIPGAASAGADAAGRDVAGADAAGADAERGEEGVGDRYMTGIVNCTARARELYNAGIARKSQIRRQFRGYYL